MSISINPNSMSALLYMRACRWTAGRQLGFCSGTRTDNRSIKHFYVPCYVFAGCAPPTHRRSATWRGVATSQPLNKASATLQQHAEGERQYKLLWCALCFHFSYYSRCLTAASQQPNTKRRVLIQFMVIQSWKESRRQHAAAPGACDLCSIRTALVHITQQTGRRLMTGE